MIRTAKGSQSMSIIVAGGYADISLVEILDSGLYFKLNIAYNIIAEPLVT